MSLKDLEAFESLHTVSLIIVPTFRSMFRSNIPISLAMSFSRLSWEETRPNLLQYIHMIRVYQLCQQVTDHSSMKGKLCDGSKCSTRSGSHCSPHLYDSLPILDLCPPRSQRLEYPGGVLDPRQTPLDVIRRCHIIGIDETFHCCVTSHNDRQRKGRPDKPFAEQIAPQGRPSVV